MFSLDLADLRNLVATAIGAPPPSITEMPGGASSRKFFRVALPNGRGTCVAMFVPDLQRSDEIAKAQIHARWSYLEVRDLLEERGVRVPALLADGTSRGWTLVEDLGDDTIAAYLDKHPEQRRTIYQIAVRDLARAQRCLSPLPDGSVIRSRAFDYDLLRWELDHFRQYALDALGRPLLPPARASFDGIADRLARMLAELPRGFVHRDYQSRNLMVVEPAGKSLSLAWVDFQDALLGPRVYDLVALLNDSYQTFDRAFVEARLGEFARELDLDATCAAELITQFDLVTVQRKLKDAGRFVFIERHKGDASYLEYVEPTLHKVRQSLERLSAYPDMVALLQILGPTLP